MFWFVGRGQWYHLHLLIVAANFQSHYLSPQWQHDEHQAVHLFLQAVHLFLQQWQYNQ
jgi:hypothetical protein